MFAEKCLVFRTQAVGIQKNKIRQPCKKIIMYFQV